MYACVTFQHRSLTCVVTWASVPVPNLPPDTKRAGCNVRPTPLAVLVYVFLGVLPVASQWADSQSRKGGV